ASRNARGHHGYPGDFLISQKKPAANPVTGTSLMIRHLITPEYPAQPGGVSDYTHLVAVGLAAQGEEVHVWCPACFETQPEADGVIVHRKLGAMTPVDLLRAGQELNQFPEP